METAKDFSEFVQWHGARVQRRTGKPPAYNTLRSKASRLRVCCEVAHLSEPEYLGTLLQDRERCEILFDGLSARMTSGSVRATMDALKAFGTYAVAKGWITGTALIPGDWPPNNPQKPIVIYTPEEMDLLLGNARGRGLRWWMFLSTVAHTGRRVGEVLGLQWEWLNLTADPPHIHLPHTKNGRQAYVPLSSVLTREVYTGANIDALRLEDRTDGSRQFSRSVLEYPFPWRYATAERMFRRYCLAIGVESRGFHCLRHTKATNLLAKGVPLQAVSALLGHANVATTDRIYNHANALAYSQYID